MISDIFFYGKLKGIDDLLIYEEEFVLFYLNIKLLDSKDFTKEEVDTILEDLYVNENMKNNAIIKFCDKHFDFKDKMYCLRINDEERELYNKVKDYKSLMSNYKNINKAELNALLEKEISEKNIEFDEKIRKMILFYNYEKELNKKTISALLYKYFYISKNYYKIYRDIDYKLEKIPAFFNVVKISELNLTEEQLSFFRHNNIFTIKDLKYMPLDLLICILCNDIKGFMEKIDIYAISRQEVINKLKADFNSIIKEEWYPILQNRFSFWDNEKKTLDELGKQLNKTRERVRQIQKAAIEALVEKTDRIDVFSYCFYKDIAKEQKSYITIKEFVDYLEDENFARNILIACSSGNIKIYFDEEYGILFNKNETSIEEILSEMRKELKEIIPMSETIGFNKMQKVLLENEYRLCRNKVFISKKINISSIYLNEIKENFINGYNIGSEEHYSRLLKIINDKYGEIEIPTMHSIQNIIDRYGFIQIDRGTYKAREYCCIFPDDFANEIIEFIKNSPIIAYSYIFEKYENRLRALGIENRFYLKGLLDEKLPKEFDTNRDFIKTDKDETTTPYDLIQQIFRSFDAEFTIDDLREKIPGLEDYTYDNYARWEEENGLIRLSARTYIYIDKLNINEEAKGEFKAFIDQLFKSLDTKVLTTKKIYASLNILNRGLFNKLHINSKIGEYGFFSIIQSLFKNEYYYSRPLISLEENVITSTYLLVKEYIRTLDKFNHADLKNYIYKMNINWGTSYINFMDELSDEYVQVGVDSMVRKENFKITEEELEKIKELIDLVSKDNDLRTDEFDGYFMLPRLERPWNKYMLIGIIKSYFRNEYDIEYTTGFYETTEFIIRRSK